MTAPSLREAVARAICKSRTCEGSNCCEWPANMGRRSKCPVAAGAYNDATDAALAVALPLIVAQCREHYAGVVEAWAAEVERKAPQSVTIVQARMHASHIRADEGPR